MSVKSQVCAEKFIFGLHIKQEPSYKDALLVLPNLYRTFIIYPLYFMMIKQHKGFNCTFKVKSEVFFETN